MEFTKPESYAKMIAIYLKNHQDEQAYELSGDFVKKFPGEFLPHLLLAESSFRLSRYAEAKIEGRKALNYCVTETDTIYCTLMFSSACFFLKDYIEGYELLKQISAKKPIVEVEEALFVFSLAMKDESRAIDHMKVLLELNRERALDLIHTYLENVSSD